MALTVDLPQLAQYVPPGALYAAGCNAQTLGKCCTCNPNCTHRVGDQPALLGSEGLPVDCFVTTTLPAAFHYRKCEITPNAMEVAEALT